LAIGAMTEPLVDLHINRIAEKPKTSVAKSEIDAVNMLTLEPADGSGICRNALSAHLACIMA